MSRFGFDTMHSLDLWALSSYEDHIYATTRDSKYLFIDIRNQNKIFSRTLFLHSHDTTFWHVSQP